MSGACAIGSRRYLSKTKIGLDARAEPGLATRRFAFDHHGVQALAGAINGGSESRRAASDNGEVIETGLRVRAQTDFVGNRRQRWFGKPRAVGKENQEKRFGFG